MITWKKVSYREEQSEFDRVADEFSKHNKANKDKIKENRDALKSFYNGGVLRSLSDEVWKRMENTESWQTKTVDEIQKVIKANARTSGTRNIENVLKEYMSSKVRAPIVMSYNKNKDYILVAGNTRLMVARMLGIKPKVVFIKTDW